MTEGMVRVGVVGLGNMGSAHATAIFNSKVPGLQLTAVCDICESRKSWCETQLRNTPFFTDYTTMLRQAPHNLDLWQWIFGMPARLRAFCYCGKYHHIEMEDDATIFAEYANGATAVFITSTGEYPGVNRLEIAGDRGHLVAEGGILKWWKMRAPERELCFSETAGFPSWETDYEEFDLRGEESGYIGILQNFSDSIRLGTPLLAAGTDGTPEIQLSNAAYLSARTDDWVDFPFPEEKFDGLLQEKQKQSVFKTGHTCEPEAMSGCYQNRGSIQG